LKSTIVNNITVLIKDKRIKIFLIFLKKKEGFFKNVWYSISKGVKWNMFPQYGTIKKE